MFSPLVQSYPSWQNRIYCSYLFLNSISIYIIMCKENFVEKDESIRSFLRCFLVPFHRNCSLFCTFVLSFLNIDECVSVIPWTWKMNYLDCWRNDIFSIWYASKKKFYKVRIITNVFSRWRLIGIRSGFSLCTDIVLKDDSLLIPKQKRSWNFDYYTVFIIELPLRNCTQDVKTGRRD
jgi:hypothetical protein